MVGKAVGASRRRMCVLGYRNIILEISVFRTPREEKRLELAERKTKALLDGATVSPVRDSSPAASTSSAVTNNLPTSPKGGRRKSQVVPRALSPEPETPGMPDNTFLQNFLNLL